jgi:hypothetical protein
MRVEATNPARCLAGGTLQGDITPQDAHHPHILIEISDGVSPPAKVELDQVDLSTIVRLADGSRFEAIRDAVRWPRPTPTQE